MSLFSSLSKSSSSSQSTTATTQTTTNVNVLPETNVGLSIDTDAVNQALTEFSNTFKSLGKAGIAIAIGMAVLLLWRKK